VTDPVVGSTASQRISLAEDIDAALRGAYLSMQDENVNPMPVVPTADTSDSIPRNNPPNATAYRSAPTHSSLQTTAEVHHEAQEQGCRCAAINQQRYEAPQQSVSLINRALVRSQQSQQSMLSEVGVLVDAMTTMHSTISSLEDVITNVMDIFESKLSQEIGKLSLHFQDDMRTVVDSVQFKEAAEAMQERLMTAVMAEGEAM
jgi:hypothetical protein